MASHPATADSEMARKRQDEQYIERVLTSIRARLREASNASDVELETALGPADLLSARLSCVIPLSNAWSGAIGAVYTQAGLARAVNKSRQAIHTQIEHGTLLCARTADNHVVIPAFQFDEQLRPLSGLSEVVGTFGDEVDAWTLLSWLTAPQPDLDGLSVVEHLRAGGALTDALVLARRTHSRWVR
ncbi:MAG: hypothetical protein WCP28_17445 [Actinomycetes bacterium]